MLKTTAFLSRPRLALLMICLCLLSLPLGAAMAGSLPSFIFSKDSKPEASEESLDRVVAIVNDDVITELELATEVKMIKKQLRSQNTRMPPDDVLQPQVLDRMVLRRIQLQLASKAHIRVDDDTLNRTLESIARQNNLSLMEFRTVLESEGMQYQKFRENMREEIIINRLQKRQVHDRINITPQEVDAYLANRALQSGTQYEYNLGHILISVPEAASPELIATARQKAEKVVADLQAGADFAQTAIAVSDGRQALEGGSLGWREISSLPTLFADWVLDREEGEISEPIRSPSGFHIIKMLGKRSNQPQTLVKQTHARHILLRPDGPGPIQDNRTRQAIEELKLRIESGEDFAELAKANSDDPGSGANGGDLGWVNPGTMVAPFENAMNALPVGKISKPVKTQFGWHIIEVLERREQDMTEEVQRSKARESIRASKLDPAMQAWTRRLRDEAFVEIRLKPPAS